MKITYIGHATVLIELDGAHILTDPNFAPRLYFFRRLSRVGIPFEHLPKIDLILQSHAHFDHLNKPTLTRFVKDTPIIAARGLSKIFQRMGFTDAVSLQKWQHAERGSLKITAVPSKHFGGRVLLVGYILGWSGFIVEGKEGTVYFPGDAAYSQKYFQEIGRRFRIDVALLPIGAYRPRWFLKNKHMNPPDAVQAFFDLQARYMVPIHWGTFRLGLERPETPLAWLDELRKEYHINERVKILQFGESFTL